jgi:hypothetical protein
MYYKDGFIVLSIKKCLKLYFLGLYKTENITLSKMIKYFAYKNLDFIVISNLYNLNIWQHVILILTFLLKSQP